MNTGLDNGLVPNRWQAIIWTSGGLVYCHLYASLGLIELIYGRYVSNPSFCDHWWMYFLRAIMLCNGLCQSNKNVLHMTLWLSYILHLELITWHMKFFKIRVNWFVNNSIHQPILYLLFRFTAKEQWNLWIIDPLSGRRYFIRISGTATQL